MVPRSTTVLGNIISFIPGKKRRTPIVAILRVGGYGGLDFDRADLDFWADFLGASAVKKNAKKGTYMRKCLIRLY